MNPHIERRLLQLVILLAAIVPVSAGAWGAAGGLHLSASGADSQVRYLSGLLLGIGLCFWAFTPTIERRGAEVRVLALIVVIGGLARLFGVVTTGAAHTVSVGPLAMELGVTPLLALWRERVERRLATSGTQDRSVRTRSKNHEPHERPASGEERSGSRTSLFVRFVRFVVSFSRLR